MPKLKKIIRFTAILLCLILQYKTAWPESFPQSYWQQYSSPEEVGWSSDELENIRLEADKIGSAAVMAVYKGHVLFAWGDVSRRYKCHSVRKSLLSALIGIYVDQGQIRLDKTIAELGIDDISPLTDEEKESTVRHMLQARSGIFHPAAKETSGIEGSRPKRGSHAPGEFFWYNNWGFNVLGVIFEQETGKKIFEDFKDEIADPLGMEDYRIQDQFYQYERSKSQHPAYAFRMSTRDLARFGWMFLQNGKWKGQQIIPADWIKESITSYSEASPGTGYGYMWWIYPKGGMRQPERYPVLNTYDKFAAIGTGGQIILVIPEAELVFIHRGDTDFSGGVSGPSIWLMAEKVLEAKKRLPKPDPELAPLKAIPFSHPSPPLPEWKEIELPPEILAKYEGEYKLEPRGSFFLRSLGNALEGWLVGQGEADFFPASKTLFFAKAANIQLTFELDENGKPVSVAIDYMSKKMLGKKNIEK